jgi:hypothetical protein
MHLAGINAPSPNYRAEAAGGTPPRVRSQPTRFQYPRPEAAAIHIIGRI